jgi:hypothetical protein
MKIKYPVMLAIRFIITIIFSLFFHSYLYAGDCNTTVTAALTEQLSCSDNDTLTVTGSISYNNQNAVLSQQLDGVTITNSGTIKTTTDGGDGSSAIKGQSSLNLTVTNSGTIWAKEDYGIKLIEAEKITITNQAGGTIKATPTDSGATIAIGGTKMGNCGTCVNGSTTSSGEGLTLSNYGTIDADSSTVYGGSNSAHTSKKTKIYNYNGGMIDATSSIAVRFQYAEDFELYNYSGATIQTGTGNYPIDLKGASTITIDNAGTISSGLGFGVGLWLTETINLDNSGTISADGNYGVYCYACEDLTLTNSGTISAGAQIGVSARLVTGTNTITNSGTISSESTKGVDLRNSTGVTLVNSGTISATGDAILADNAFSPTIINSGTITASAGFSTLGAITLSQNDAEDLGSGATITNSGTISASGTNAVGIIIGDGTGVYNDVTITNSGTISGVDDSIGIVGSGTTGTNIITKGEATYTGEIEMDSAAATMTLDCSITKDMDIEIHGKTNMTVTSNLCGNDTYEILDSSKNADADNSETDGYLRILGEDLDIDSNNHKYRSEIFLAKLNNIFIGISDDKEQGTYYSSQKRNDIYKNYENSVLGFFEQEEKINYLNRPFISYSDQRASFNNSEYRGSKNLAFGLKKQIETEKYNVSIVPVVGLSQNKIVDVETETNQTIEKDLLSQFAGVNTVISRKKDFRDESNLLVEIQGTYGIHRLPKYISNFTDGDLSVDDAIDQVLGAGFSVKYSKENNNGFVLEPYVGLSINNTLSNDVQIIADGENKEAGHVMNGVLAKRAGLTISKHTDNISFSFNIEHDNQDGLKENTLGVSISKKLQRISKIRKEKEKIVPELEALYDQLQLAKQNEMLKGLADEVIEENKVIKQLLLELLKENQKLKTENKIFKKAN